MGGAAQLVGGQQCAALEHQAAALRAVGQPEQKALEEVELEELVGRLTLSARQVAKVVVDPTGGRVAS